MGYPSNARCPVWRGTVSGAGGRVWLYRQPDVQVEASHARRNARAARNRPTSIRRPVEWQPMKSRIDTLEARRQALLNKCEEQRLELAYRVAQITPKAALTAWSRRAGSKGGKNPLPWIAGAAGLLMMLLRRRRRARGGLAGLGLVTTLLALTTRATTILRVLAQLRALYMWYKATRRRPG